MISIANILVFIGSPRKSGNTHVLANELKSILDSRKHKVDFVIYTKNIHPCEACYYCSHSPNNCRIKDDLTPYIQKFVEYDAIILMSPIYFFGLSAQAKTFLDRIGAGIWDSKVVALITASGSSGRMGGNDLLVDAFERICEYNKCFFAGFYNKVTNDAISPIDNRDKLGLTTLVDSIENLVSRMRKG